MPNPPNILRAMQGASHELPEPLGTVAELSARLMKPHRPNRQKIDEDSLYRALSEQIGVPYVRLGEFGAGARAVWDLSPSPYFRAPPNPC